MWKVEMCEQIAWRKKACNTVLNSFNKYYNDNGIDIGKTFSIAQSFSQRFHIRKSQMKFHCIVNTRLRGTFCPA